MVHCISLLERLLLENSVVPVELIDRFGFPCRADNSMVWRVLALVEPLIIHLWSIVELREHVLVPVGELRIDHQIAR